MEIKNSYILLRKEQKAEKSQKKAVADKETHAVVLSTKKAKKEEPFKDYLSSCFSDIAETNHPSKFITLYECKFKYHRLPNLKAVVHHVRGDFYVDITISGKNKDKMIQQMELIHNTLRQSTVAERFTLITSYDAVSEYYCNKMFLPLNEVERKLRKLLYIIYTVRYRRDYIDYTFVENTLAPESKSKIESYLKHQLGSDRELWRQKYFEEFEYHHYNHLLFFPKWTPVDIANKETFLNDNKDLATLTDEELRARFAEFSPKSDWEKYFVDKVDENISAESLIKNVKNQRNGVAHYKSITKKEYDDFIINVAQLIDVIDKAIDIAISKDFVEQTIKHYNESMRAALDEILSVIDNFQRNMAFSITESALSVIDVLIERFCDKETASKDMN